VRDLDTSASRRWSWAFAIVLVAAIFAILAFGAWYGIGEDSDSAETTETTVSDPETEASGLPAAFVALRSRDNPIVPGTDEFTELLRLSLPPGSYLVSGKVGLHNRDASASFLAACTLVPSKEDGTGSIERGDFGTDWANVHLGPSGGPGEHGEFAVSVAQVLADDGSVVLGCSGRGSASGAFAQWGWIRALEVDSVETVEVGP
jgi:hypothetical protein